MRTLTSVGLLVLIIITATLAAAPGTAPVTAQGEGAEVAHLVLSVDNGSDASLNRVDWNVNAFAPLVPGTSVRENDYVDLSGRTTLVILCTDLEVLDQRGSEVPRCNPYPDAPFFFFADDPTWMASQGPVTVVVMSSDLSAFTTIIDNPGAHNLDELVGDELTQVINQANRIKGLEVPPEGIAFALSSYFRQRGMTFDAIRVLLTIPDLGCSRRRPAVDPPTGAAWPLVQTPVVYLRLGELFEMLGQTEDAARNYRCAADLAETLSDPANTALAYARQANIIPDPIQAAELYQVSIDNYAQLGAKEYATAMLEICGSRNCTMPQ